MRIINAILTLCLILPGPTVTAQTASTGSIEGRITASNGAGVSGVRVTAVGPNLIRAQSATTDRDGRFRIWYLPPGRYKVLIESPQSGFPHLEHSDVEVSLSRTSSVSVRWRGQEQGKLIKATAQTRTGRITAPVSAPKISSASHPSVPPAASTPSGLPALSTKVKPPPKPSPAPPTSSALAKSEPVSVTAQPVAIAPAPDLTSVYRIGAGDVLDIQVPKLPSPASTLFTIAAAGMLDYPLAGEPFVAAGMTTDELSARLTAELKRRAIINDQKVLVDVRQYASHNVLVSGLVGQPGTKVLQREAVPIFVLLAQAELRPEAERALIMSPATGRKTMVDLGNPSATEAIVQAGDVVIVSARPVQFIYIGGDIQSPGERRYHPGMTLTQAILAAGGVSRSSATNIKVARQGEAGLLNVIMYNLKDIMSGKTPDPRLEPGDRIEVSN